MGICFFCPNGHPLNVKSELAGKVGYCPKCRVKMRIPLQSMREPYDKVYTGQPTAELVDLHPSHDSNGESEKLLGNGTGASLSDQEANTDKSLAHDSSNEKLDIRFTNIDGSALKNEETPEPENPKQGWKIEDLLGRREVLWYVISAEGQKYGPATGDILKKWVNERRIGPRMHLWCSLWKSSLEAGDMFPVLIDLFGDGTKEKANILSRDVVSQSDSSKEEYVSSIRGNGDSVSLNYDMKRQKQKATLSLVLVLTWVVTMICVLGVLIWFVCSKSH